MDTPSPLPRTGLQPRWIAALMLTVGLTGCVVAPPYGYRHHRHEAVVIAPAPIRNPPPPPMQPPPAAPAPSDAMFFYPERGQDEERQDRDRYECYRWAVKQSGVDPGMTPTRSAAPPPEVAPVRRDGGAVAAGAITGGAVGAILSGPRRGGEGMILGAIFGAAMGAAAEESRAQAAERAQAARARDWEAREAQRRVPLDGFRRAMSACMSGRGYAVR